MLEPQLQSVSTEEDVSVRNCVSENLTLSQTQRNEENPFTFRPQPLFLQQEHELFEEGDVQRHMYLQNLYVSAAEEEAPLSVAEFSCHISGCTVNVRTLAEYEHHYNSVHRHVCCTCRRSLPTAALLDLHIQETHDSLFTLMAQRQDMFQCLVEGCGLKFRTTKDRKEHLINVHKYPPDFRFDKVKKDKRDRRRDADVELVSDACESEGVCELLCEAMNQTQTQEEEEAMNQTQTQEEDSADDAREEKPSDMETSPDPTEQTRPRSSSRVPSSVCFGHGSRRGFRGRRGKRT